MKKMETCFSMPLQKLKGRLVLISQRFFLTREDSLSLKSPVSVILEFCQNCLILYDADKQFKGGIPYCYETKFKMEFINSEDVRSQMIGFKINYLGKQTSFYSDDAVGMRKCWNHLISKINYNGFIGLFQRSMKIGQGAFSSVHMATFLIDDRRMAIKSVQKSQLLKDVTRKKSFFSQIETMRQLNHQNVNKLYGVFQSQKIIYQAIELIDCGQLAYRFKSNYQFSSFEIKLIMEGLLKGLNHIHSKGIMHRDIKPQNIMFRTKNTDSQIVIVDFGLAVFCDSHDYIWYRCGTPGYIAPQILLNKTNKKLDPVVDIFSVGSIFYRILFGKSLFPGKSHNQVLAMNMACQFDFVQLNLINNFTTATLDLLMKMLDVNPATRITAEQALTHPFFSQSSLFKDNSPAELQYWKMFTEQKASYSPIRKQNSSARLNYSQQKIKKHKNSPTKVNHSPQLSKRCFQVN